MMKDLHTLYFTSSQSKELVSPRQVHSSRIAKIQAAVLYYMNVIFDTGLVGNDPWSEEASSGQEEARAKLGTYPVLLGLAPSEDKLCRALSTSLMFHQVHGGTYEVEAGIGERLLRTELRGVTCRYLKPPLPSMLIRAPSCVGPDGFAGAYICEKVISRGLIGTALNIDQVLDDPSTRRVIQICMLLRREEKFDYPLPWGFMEFPLEADGDLGKVVAEISPPQDVSDFTTILKWLCNVILYVTSSKARVEIFEENKDRRALEKRLKKAKGSKRKRLNNRLKDCPSSRVIIVGAGVPRLDEGGKGEKLTVRTLVPGHWQHYWVGGKKGSPNAKRDYQLKEPYWKGPEDGPLAKEALRKLV